MHIFVGNLAFTTTEQELRACFEAYGTVETVRMMTDRDTGRARLWLCRDAEQLGGPGRDCWGQRNVVGGTATDGE